MHSQVILFLIAICAVGSLSQLNLPPRNECTKNGAYCQNHWECCSNSCLSYSYKCVKSNGPQNVAPLDTNFETTTYDRDTLQNLVDNLFASTDRPANYNVPVATVATRFDETETTTSGVPQPTTVLFSDCKVIGLKCFRDSECCTKRCHGFLHQCVT